MTASKKSVEAAGDGPVTQVTPPDATPPDAEAVPETGHRFMGGPGHAYPSRRDPRDGSVLTPAPGEVFDFGVTEELPPADGLWYDVASGTAYLGPDEPDEGEAAGTDEEG